MVLLIFHLASFDPFQNSKKMLTIHLNIRECDPCIDHMEDRNLNFNRETRWKLHMDEIFQFLTIHQYWRVDKEKRNKTAPK